FFKSDIRELTFVLQKRFKFPVKQCRALCWKSQQQGAICYCIERIYGVIVGGEPKAQRVDRFWIKTLASYTSTLIGFFFGLFFISTKYTNE
ncbi:hypothetical protein M8C21_009983, partial [Ambrosia artemisiifolia]